MDLPEDLRTSLAEQLEKTSIADIAAAVRRVSARYREQRAMPAEPLLRSPTEIAAYAAYRLPATFATIRAVFQEVEARRPNLNPRTILDAGAGPGTAAWAAATTWPGLNSILVLENDARMISFGRALAVCSTFASVRSALWERRDLRLPWEAPPADVVVGGYVLGELPAEDVDAVVARLWDHTHEVCVLVEPGTPKGSALVLRASQLLAEIGAHVVAPFPADWQCLEHESDWCHFSERVARTHMHRVAKSASLSYEDEKYSYVVASRRPGVPIGARVLRHPQTRPGVVRLVLCTAEGVRHVTVARSSREAYRKARDLHWGAAISPEDATLFGLA